MNFVMMVFMNFSGHISIFFVVFILYKLHEKILAYHKENNSLKHFLKMTPQWIIDTSDL